MSHMTGRERTLAALNFEPTDRVPVVGGFVRHVGFLAGAAGCSLEDFWADPRRVAIRAFRNLGADCIIGLILPDPKSKTGAQYDHHQQTRFNSPEEVIEEISSLPPAAELKRDFDYQKHYDAFLHTQLEGQRDIGKDILWIPNSMYCVAQFQHEGRFGAANYYMALALYPQEMERFFAHSGEEARLANMARARAIVEHDLPRVIWTGQDICDNRGPFTAPPKMNEMYIRHVKRSLQPFKEVGVTVIWHSDGNIMPVVPYLLDAGVDGFQGLQEDVETRVDVTALREMETLQGRPPIIVGSVSSVRDLPFGTPEDVRAAVRRCTALAREKGGGWLLNSSSSIGPETPVANIQALFDEGRKIA